MFGKYALFIIVGWTLMFAICHADGIQGWGGLQPQNLPPPPPEPSSGFYSKNEKELIEYLSQHELPFYSRAPSGPVNNTKELPRAAELFHTGSSELRLAIAGAIQTFAWNGKGGEACYQMWLECGPEDWEAKHYLAGAALHGSSTDEQRSAVREWLLKSAHPSFASALLKTLRKYSLYEGMSGEEMDRFLSFLRELYRQPGNVIVAKGYVAEEGAVPTEDRIRSVQESVVWLLPPTVAGGNQLMDWMIADSKKLDKRTLYVMGRKWQELALPYGGKPPVAADLLLKSSTSLAMAESSILGSNIGRWDRASDLRHYPALSDASKMLHRLVLAQVFNPDAHVQKEAVGALFNNADDVREAIKGVTDVSRSTREQGIRFCKEWMEHRRQGLAEDKRMNDAERQEYYARLQKRYEMAIEIMAGGDETLLGTE